MKRILPCALLLLACVAVAVAGGPTSAPFSPAATADGSRPLDLLPSSTLFAAEIVDLAGRWPEIRNVPAIARFQDRVLAGAALGPDDLPRLAGERAVLALVAAADGGGVIPVAVLRPADPGTAETCITQASGGRLTVRRARGALWLGPAGEANLLERVAQGDGTSLANALPMGEIERRLPPGGLVRAWFHPRAVRDFVARPALESNFGVVRLLGALLGAEMDAMRFAAFRRDLVGGELVTEALVAYDTAALPPEVASTLSPAASPAPMPATLPEGTIFASAFRLEPRAWLPWLRYVAAAEPRGPLRNLDFWISQFEERTGRDVQRDLIDSLGEHAWVLVFAGDAPDDAPGMVLVLESCRPRRAEAALVDLRDWWADLIWGRTLFLLSPRGREFELAGGLMAHGLTFRTPVGEYPGPVFLSTGHHVLVGTGERALGAGLRFIVKLRSSEPADATAAQESMVVRGPALARLIEAIVPAVAARDDEDARTLVGAIVDLLDDVPAASASVTNEGDAVRVRGRVRFDDTAAPR